MRVKVEQYDRVLCRYLQLKSRPAAPNLNIENVQTWLDNRGEPISSDEVVFTYEGDLISVAASEKPVVRRVFEQKILAPTRGLWGLLPPRPSRTSKKDGLSTTVQGDDGPINLIATVAVFCVVLTMLIAPLWALAYMKNLESKLGAITGFTLILLAFLSWGTLARPFEMLAATAGYCAVLVVFLQLGDTKGSA